MRHVFVHIGDLHVCSSHPRNQDRLDALDQITEKVRPIEELAAVLIPGDLFHQKSTVEDRNALAPRLQDLAHLAPVVLTYGNHDVPGDLDIFSKLETRWPIHVINRPHVLRFSTATDVEAACFVLPYPHKAGLVGAGVEHDHLGQTARDLLEPIFMEAAAALDEAAAEGALTLMIGHVNVGGSVASTGQPQIGRELELDPALLNRLGPIYKGLNHIHKHQVLHRTVYAGSVCRLDFGEREPKGFITIEMGTDGTTPVPYVFGEPCEAGADRFPWRATFLPLDIPRQFNVEGRLTRDAFTITTIDDVTPCACQGTGIDELQEDSRCECGANGWRGADVRVKYSYRKSEIGTLALAKIHAEFAEARSLKLDPVPEIDHEVRAPEIAAAVTLEAKVDAFCALNRIPVTALVREALTALQAKDRDALLADVRAFAAAAGTDATVPAELTEVA